jgi:GPH family glycoside/pentoside/hexuronide:cation symporter/probable glucitol transport protein GutA
MVGYVANAQQTPEAINGINVVVNLIPGILFLVAIIPMCFYKITKERADKNSSILVERHKERAN